MNQTGLVGGRRVEVASLLVLILIGLFLFNPSDIGITGFVVYKNTSVEENTADGEGMLYPNGTWGTNISEQKHDHLLATYKWAQVHDPDSAEANQKRKVNLDSEKPLF